MKWPYRCGLMVAPGWAGESTISASAANAGRAETKAATPDPATASRKARRRISAREHETLQVVVHELPVGVVAATEVAEVAEPAVPGGDLRRRARVHLAPVGPR